MPEQWAIQVSHLNKSFGTLRAISNLNFNVREGEIYGFLGPNGSGKTTTMRLLCGLLKPDNGNGLCLGYDIRTQAYAIRQRIGYMSQHFSLYTDLSVYENLQFIAQIYGMTHRKARIEDALKRFHLTDRKHQLAGHLSGGWQQRLALTAVLLHNPKLLLLDEPTAGIDLAARREFWSQIQHLSRQGITALVSTHYMDEATRCDRLAYISKGHVLIKGTPHEVIQQSKLRVFELTGKTLPSMLEKIHENWPAALAVILNQRLRIIVDDMNRWQNVLKHNQWEALAWKMIEPTLEDVFVYFKEKNGNH